MHRIFIQSNLTLLTQLPVVSKQLRIRFALKSSTALQCMVFHLSSAPAHHFAVENKTVLRQWQG